MGQPLATAVADARFTIESGAFSVNIDNGGWPVAFVLLVICVAQVPFEMFLMFLAFAIIATIVACAARRQRNLLPGAAVPPPQQPPVQPQDAPGSQVLHGHRVYIKVADQDLWLCSPVPGKYCATVGPANERAPFLFTRGEFEGKSWIKLAYDGGDRGDHLKDRRFLYGAGYTRYGRLSGSNSTQQMWVLDTACKVNFKYNERVLLLSRHSFRYMAANLNNKAKPFASGKFWVEAVRDHQVHGDHRIQWTFEKVTPKRSASES